MCRKATQRLLAAFTVIITLSACHRQYPVEQAEAVPWNLSREGFIQELVYPEGTPRTPHFDDYTDGSYHVNKQDLLEGIQRYRSRRPDIIGAVIAGPMGPVWEYKVKLFLREEEGVRFNIVVFPHARITLKATKILTEETYSGFLDTVKSCSALLPGPASEESVGGLSNDQTLEWQYGLLISDWSSGEELTWHYPVDLYIFISSSGEEIWPKQFDTKQRVDAENLLDTLADLTEDMTITYIHNLEPEAKIFNPETYEP
jgi:hypothetical protein